METSNKLTIIYDDSCPMCNIYTKAFTKHHWIDQRCGFSDASSEILNSIDPVRSKNEIPLYDASTHTTVYGTDALMLILGKRFAILKPFFSLFILRYLVKKLYYFISYNRRIIAGTLPAEKGFDCTPQFNLQYRLAYLAFATGIGNILFYFSGNWYLGVALSAFLLISSVFHGKRMDYLGHSFTVFIISALINILLSIVAPLYLLLVVSTMVFGYLYYKRLVVLKTVDKTNGIFKPGFIITKALIEVGKVVLLLRAKKYKAGELPAWLDLPMSKTDMIGKNFYQQYACENNFQLRSTNSTGLCDLNKFNSSNFNAGKVNTGIRDFYLNTHLYGFKVEQQWKGWWAPLLKLFIRYYNSGSQQFNFNHISKDQQADVENLLTPIQTPTGEMMSWVRQNTSSDTTMFAGFYQVDHLPDHTDKTCVTTRFPLRNACLMVKLQPTNELGGNFSFQSHDAHMGGYSFYVVMRYGKNYFVTTLPVKEELSITAKHDHLEVQHCFSWFKQAFFILNYVAYKK